MLTQFGELGYDEGDGDQNRALRHALVRDDSDESDGYAPPEIEDQIDDELSSEYELALEESDPTARSEALTRYVKKRSKRIEELLWKQRQAEGQRAAWLQQQEDEWKAECARRAEFDSLKRHLSTISREDLMAEANKESQSEIGAECEGARSDAPLGAEEKFLRQNRDRFQDAFELYNEAFFKALVNSCSFTDEDSLMKCSQSALMYAERAAQNYMQALMKATPPELGEVEIFVRERLRRQDSGEA